MVYSNHKIIRATPEGVAHTAVVRLVNRQADHSLPTTGCQAYLVVLAAVLEATDVLAAGAAFRVTEAC